VTLPRVKEAPGIRPAPRTAVSTAVNVVLFVVELCPDCNAFINCYSTEEMVRYMVTSLNYMGDSPHATQSSTFVVVRLSRSTRYDPLYFKKLGGKSH